MAEHPRITLEELTRLTAEVMDVEPRLVTCSWRDTHAIHIGAIHTPLEGASEYRSIDIHVSRCQDSDGSGEATHVFSVLYDVLEGILRRRTARRARLGRPLVEGPPTSRERCIVLPYEVDPPFVSPLDSVPPELGGEALVGEENGEET